MKKIFSIVIFWIFLVEIAVSAPYLCQGKVKSILIEGQDQSLTVLLDTPGFNHWRICHVDRDSDTVYYDGTRGYIPPEICNAWRASLMQAQLTKAPVYISFNDTFSCNTRPDWFNGTPYTVEIQQGLSFTGPQGPAGAMGPQGPVGPTVKSLASCTSNLPPNATNQCSCAGKTISRVINQVSCSVTAETGSCTGVGLSENGILKRAASCCSCVAS
ncbi:collagen-like protein [Methylomonas koyamae]|uniref:collagen-like triple helix repeat-containing protein n=1 Tax=Methylomonas koyamae TaxID=702114 RepID=UPI0011275A0F|nr:collagen-like protein [Methylomonas koyamae]